MTAFKTDVFEAWATEDDLASPCTDCDLDPDEVYRALHVASDILFNMTRRRWPGVATEKVRPCYSSCATPGSCECGGTSGITLPGQPVVSVSEVKVDGVILADTLYEVIDTSTLIAKRAADGTLTLWPLCQDLSLDDDSIGTWSVTYRYGALPPIGGVDAAASLACQLLLSRQPSAVASGLCRLPQRVTSITRQNVSFAILDPLTLFSEGRTGLVDVDLWIESVNRGDRMRRATFIDPLRERAVHRQH